MYSDRIRDLCITLSFVDNIKSNETYNKFTIRHICMQMIRVLQTQIKEDVINFVSISLTPAAMIFSLAS